MKIRKRTVLSLVAAAVVAAVIVYFRFGGVTHEDLYDAVVGGTDDVKETVNARYTALDARLQVIDAKLDRVDAKLDRLLMIAERPLPDGMTDAGKPKADGD